MEAVIYSFEDGIATVLLNRPKAKNAMDMDLLKGLLDGLRRAEAEKASFVVIRGAGKAFCSGGDLVAFKNAEDTEALIDKMAYVLHEAIKLIRRMDAIVIAVMEGVAAGAGIGLALACDLTLAAEGTIMNMGYRRIGLTPDGGGSFFLPRLIGAKKFSELYLFSRNFTATEARDLGIVNDVVEESAIDEALSLMIKELAGLPMETIRYFKELVNASVFSGLDTHLDKERIGVSSLGAKPLFKQHLDQFFKKK